MSGSTTVDRQFDTDRMVTTGGYVSSVRQTENASKTVYATVTKYSKIETCPRRRCITAMGTTATPNRTAACPRSHPFGTKIRVGGKDYICEDRTHIRFDGRFDLYEGDDREAYDRALQWGVKKTEVDIFDY